MKIILVLHVPESSSSNTHYRNLCPTTPQPGLYMLVRLVYSLVPNPLSLVQASYAYSVVPSVWNIATCCLTMGICSEIYVSRWFHRVYLQQHRRYSLLFTYAGWYSLLLLGCKPVQYVAVQTNHKIKSSPREMTQ